MNNMTDGTTIAAQLTAAEQSELVTCEEIIGRGLATFIDVGRALARVREARLYRAQFGTFEEYCAERWDLSSKHANNLVAAAEVQELISGTTVPKINSERQARELAPLLDEPDLLKEAWQEVIEKNNKPTAAAIREVVQEKIKQNLQPAPPKNPPETPSASSAPPSKSGPTIAELEREMLPERLIKEIIGARERVRAVVRGVHGAQPELSADERTAVEEELAELAEIITVLRTSLTVGNLDNELIKLLEGEGEGQ